MKLFEFFNIFEGKEITMYTNPEWFGADVDKHYYRKQPSKYIPIDKFVPWEPADKMLDPASAKTMQKFMDKIQAGKKLNPIVAIPKGNKYLIVDGHHRYFASMKMGATMINAVIADPEDVKYTDEVPADESVQKGLINLENFKDGKVKGKSRPGRVKKAGASCKGSVSSLRAKAKKYSGEKGKMYHWCANMKGGKKK